MVAVCDPKYDISDYLDQQHETMGDRVELRFGSQSPGGVCTATQPRLAESHTSCLVSWKYEANELLGAASEDPAFNWRQLYNAMYSAFPASVVTRDTSELEQTFALLAEQWRKDTGVLSSIEMMAMHPAYQRIIGMGPAALPLILSELQRQPDHWFWALSAITGENPVDPSDAGNLAKMTEAWLRLGRKRGWK